MAKTIKVHFADLIFGRPCCGNCGHEASKVTGDESAVTCARCRQIIDGCNRRERAREAAHA